MVLALLFCGKNFCSYNLPLSWWCDRYDQFIVLFFLFFFLITIITGYCVSLVWLWKSRHLCAALIYLTQYLSGSHGETLGSQWFFRFHCGVLGLEPGHQACMASSFTCSAISLALFSFSWLSFKNCFIFIFLKRRSCFYLMISRFK